MYAVIPLMLIYIKQNILVVDFTPLHSLILLTLTDLNLTGARLKYLDVSLVLHVVCTVIPLISDLYTTLHQNNTLSVTIGTGIHFYNSKVYKTLEKIHLSLHCCMLYYP